MILEGKKTCEIRCSRTNKRERIALIRCGSGLVVGTCEIVDVIGPLSKSEMLQNFKKHRIPLRILRHGLPHKKNYAWVLKNAKPLREPVPYRHPRGAMIWVKLTPATARKIAKVL